MGKAKSSRTVPTLKALAALVSRSESAVSRWCQRGDWPFARRAPWPRSDVPRVQKWAAETLTRDTAGGEGAADPETRRLRREKLRQETRKIAANADQAETALAHERAGLIDAAEARREWDRLKAAVRAAFDALPGQAAALAVGQGMPAEAQAMLREQVAQAVAGVLAHLQRRDQSDGGTDYTSPTPLLSDK